jgi:hypothetical protein
MGYGPGRNLQTTLMLSPIKKIPTAKQAFVVAPVPLEFDSCYECISLTLESIINDYRIPSLYGITKTHHVSITDSVLTIKLSKDEYQTLGLTGKKHSNSYCNNGLTQSFSSILLTQHFLALNNMKEPCGHLEDSF